MKRHFLGFCFVVFLSLTSCDNKKGAIISYKAKIINLGDIQFRKAFAGKILIKNYGDKKLRLLDISTDCSCTITNVDHKEILPGDSSYIRFAITPAVDGFIQQSIYVNNTSINENRVLFLIRAKVKLL